MKILSRFTGNVIFESDHTETKLTVKAAIQSGANLSGADLSVANLCWTDLSAANLSGANLSGANLSRADLSVANLCWTDLSGANLSGANLSGANLSNADLSVANLCWTDLSGAYLSGANLSNADLSVANLSNADLSVANLSETIGLYFQICPKGGSFTAWKKASNCVVELKIPAWAMRTSSIGSRKCRAEFAIVVDIRDKKQNQVKSVVGDYDCRTVYEIGKIMKPDAYDPDPRVGCSHGIHFFMTREEAENY